jgi:hypothetical protein
MRAASANPNKARRKVIIAGAILVAAGLCTFVPIFVVNFLF